jgi:hypothetical protein
MAFFGKYRGKVTSSLDPLHLGRVQVQVPAIFGDERSSWAMPCTPYGGKDIGLVMVPPVGTNVWVEFEGGDANYPIWSGCFWGEHELPKQAQQCDDPASVQVFRTMGATLTVSREEKTKGIRLDVEEPMVKKPLKLIYNPDGIEFSYNDTMSIKLLAEGDVIEIRNGDQSIATIAADHIQLQESKIQLKLTDNSIELQCSPAMIKLSTGSGVELSHSPAKTVLSSSGVEISSTPASVKLSAGGVEAKSGGLGTIQISPASVNVNNGALEVT